MFKINNKDTRTTPRRNRKKIIYVLVRVLQSCFHRFKGQYIKLLYEPLTKGLPHISFKRNISAKSQQLY